MSLLRQYARQGSASILGLCLLAQTTIAFAVPLTVEQAVNMALENHLDIKKAVNSEKQAEYALESAKGSRGFSIDASNTFYLKRINYPANSSSSAITLSLPLYTGGKNEGNIEIAKTDLTIAGLSLLKTKQDVKLNTITAYYDVIEARKTQAVDQETVDNYVKHLNDVKAQYSVGNIAKSDVLRSEVELTDAQQTLIKAKNAYEVAINNFKNMIRWKSSEAIEFVEDFQYVPVNKTMDECVAYAKEHRPDVKKYRLAIDETEKTVEVTKADKKPSVSLTAATGWHSTVLPNDDNKNTYVGITSSWNLFDSQVTNAKVKKAINAVENARLDLTAQEDSVELSVKEYYLGMREAEKRIATTKFAVHKAEEDYFIAKEKYRVGEGIILDVIDAQLALTTAKNNYITAQYDYVTYKAKLENAMGID
ncbi:TolC family protein [Sporomusa acidovorans]|uniref:Outer membrane protein TolC n=1 Tax=Sporomusa acidovorans (strain ATCC 49682 / DSM 3132 / Mol) TaxID=1123286 RepID=A0ABZ3IXS7_SPOA4|nr:TolC family protein [Sporomusa acidovorans]OZC22404.1 outer membrane protein TolC precursor [Sporomusa acidovorans DSM 3132]SDE48222.1 Outer membrane protein TolC [Sporomusa acidovorans]